MCRPSLVWYSSYPWTRDHEWCACVSLHEAWPWADRPSARAWEQPRPGHEQVRLARTPLIPVALAALTSANACRPRIDYCEIYQDGLSVLNSLGVNLTNHMPQGIRSFIKDDSLHAGGASKETSIYDRMSGFMSGLGSISLPGITSTAGSVAHTSGDASGSSSATQGAGITEQARHAVEGITDTVSSLAERAKEALGITSPTKGSAGSQSAGK